MPDKCMSTQKLAILRSEIDESVCPVEREFSLRGLGRVPFHRVFRRQLAKVGFDDGGVLGLGEGAGVCGCAPVELSSGHEFVVEGADVALALEKRGGAVRCCER